MTNKLGRSIVVFVAMLPLSASAESTEEKATVCEAMGNLGYIYMLHRQSGMPQIEALKLTDEESSAGLRELAVIVVGEVYDRPILPKGFGQMRAAQDYSEEVQLRCWKARSSD